MRAVKRVALRIRQSREGWDELRTGTIRRRTRPTSSFQGIDVLNGPGAWPLREPAPASDVVVATGSVLSACKTIIVRFPRAVQPLPNVKVTDKMDSAGTAIDRQLKVSIDGNAL